MTLQTLLIYGLGITLASVALFTSQGESRVSFRRCSSQVQVLECDNTRKSASVMLVNSNLGCKIYWIYSCHFVRLCLSGCLCDACISVYILVWPKRCGWQTQGAVEFVCKFYFVIVQMANEFQNIIEACHYYEIQTILILMKKMANSNPNISQYAV